MKWTDQRSWYLRRMFLWGLVCLFSGSPFMVFASQVRVFAAAYTDPGNSKKIKKQMDAVLQNEPHATPYVTGQRLHVSLLGGDGLGLTYSSRQAVDCLRRFIEKMPPEFRISFESDGDVRRRGALKYSENGQFVQNPILPPQRKLVVVFKEHAGLQALQLGQRTLHTTLLHNPADGQDWHISDAFATTLAPNVQVLNTVSVMLHLTENVYQLEVKMRARVVETVLWQGVIDAHGHFDQQAELGSIRFERDEFLKRLNMLDDRFFVHKEPFFRLLVDALMQQNGQALSLNPKRSAGRLNLHGMDFWAIGRTATSAFLTPSPVALESGPGGAVFTSSPMDNDVDMLAPAGSFGSEVYVSDSEDDDAVSEESWGDFQLASPTVRMRLQEEAEDVEMADSVSGVETDYAEDTELMSIHPAKMGDVALTVTDAAVHVQAEIEPMAQTRSRKPTGEDRFNAAVILALKGAQLGHHYRQQTHQPDNPMPVFWLALLGGVFGALTGEADVSAHAGQGHRPSNASPALRLTPARSA